MTAYQTTTPLNRLSDLASRNKHVYGDLDSSNFIRLLDLEPGLKDDPITFTLRTTRHHQHSDAYEALSYCWGAASDPVKVHCNDDSFYVTPNLHDALVHLRLHDRPRRLWIDAICINQHDITERSQQVSLMRHIYAQAERVVVWLGVSSTSSADAISTINAIAKECCLATYGQGEAAWWNSMLRKEHTPSDALPETPLRNLPPSSSPSWQALKDFFQRPWFSRVWVVQEVQAGTDILVMCGSTTVDWEFVTLVASWLASPRAHEDFLIFWNASRLFRTTEFMRQNLATLRDDPFLVVLERIRSFSSTDPRDRIFALLYYGVVADESYSPHKDRSNRMEPVTLPHLGIQADYSKTMFQVCQEVALQSILKRRCLEILCYVDLPTAQKSGQPTWIPRWELNEELESSRHAVLPYLYDSSRGRDPEISRKTSETLTLRGIHVGLVAKTDPILPIGTEQDMDTSSLTNSSSRLASDRLQSLARLITLDTSTETSVSNVPHARATENTAAHVSNFAAFMLHRLEGREENTYLPLTTFVCDRCDTTLVDHYSSKSEPPVKYSCEICRNGLYDLCEACYNTGKHCLDAEHELHPAKSIGLWYVHSKSTMDSLKRHAVGGTADGFHLQSRNASYCKVFFSTADGWVGSGPVAMKAGDVLAVLYGGRMPLILRRDGAHYCVVGPCFVFGLMDGEALEMCDQGQVAEQEFELR